MALPIQRAFARFFKMAFGLATDPALQLQPYIVPVFNAQPLFDGREDVQWVEQALAVPANSPGFLSFTVGAGEQWDVKQIGAVKPSTTAVSVAPTIGIRPAVTIIAGGAQGYGVAETPSGGASSINVLFTGRYFDTPLVLTAGDSVCVMWVLLHSLV